MVSNRPESFPDRVESLAEQGLNSEEIADELYCTNHTIKRIADIHNLDIKIIDTDE